MADDTSTTENTDAPPATDEADTPPADLGDAGKKALDRMKAERDAARKEAKANAEAAKRLAQFEDAQKSEAEKAAERLAAAEQSAAAAQRELARFRVIAESGLPSDLHEFVVGDTEDELRDRAAKLAAKFSADQRSVDVGLGPRSTPPSADMNTALRRAAGRA